MPVIKKYGNRRMYDTETSRYVNLDDVAEMVRNGEDVQVIDAQTEEDLTRVVLTQIIVEGAKSSDSPLPIDFLRQIIVASSRAQQDLLTRYFNFVFGLYEKAQTEMRDRVSGSRPMINPFDAFQRVLSGQVPWSGFEKTESPPPSQAEEEEAPPDESTQAELAMLKKRLEELESRLGNG